MARGGVVNITFPRRYAYWYVSKEAIEHSARGTVCRAFVLSRVLDLSRPPSPPRLFSVLVKNTRVARVLVRV